MEPDEMNTDLPSSSEDNDIYNELLEALSPIQSAETASNGPAGSSFATDGNIISVGDIKFDSYSYLDPQNDDLKMQISLQAGRVDYDPSSACFILYKNNFFSVSVSAQHAGNAIANDPVSCILYGIVNDFAEGGAEPERVDVLQSGPSRKAEDSFPVAAQHIFQNGQVVQFQRLRFSRASANVSTAKKRKRTDGSVDRGLSIAFRLIVVILDSNTGHVHRAAMSAPLLVRGQNPSRYGPSSLAASRQIVTSPSSEVSSPSPRASDTLSLWRSEADGSITTAAKVGIGLGDRLPVEQLEVQGNVIVNGAIYTPSDERIKKNFVPLDTDEMLENVSNVKLYEYEYKDRPGKKVRGVIAQEVAGTIPHSVSEVTTEPGNDEADSPSSLLVVNDRALMIENLGATQRLAKLFRTVSLRTKIIGTLALVAIIISITVATLVALSPTRRDVGPQKDAPELLLGDWSSDRFSDPKSTLSWISLSLTGIQLRLPDIGLWSGVVSASSSEGDFVGVLTLSNSSASIETITVSWVSDPCRNGLTVSIGGNKQSTYLLYRAIPMLNPRVPTLYIISTLFTCVNGNTGIFLSKATLESGLPELILSNATGVTSLLPASRSCFDFSFVTEFNETPLTSISAQVASHAPVKYYRASNSSSISIKRSYLFTITRTDGLRAILVASVLDLSPSGVARVQVAALQYEWSTSSRRSQNDCPAVPQQG
eukprot:TRINITY_DN3529_c0_g1_i1.p1 TRINITY_DN3529_c0_g1~~TRINITY_DN3529_c0_g1_i1.p1  ORF type:complete len:709 (+),score=91.74 TRINITY_DN3529_c0_g1_i1:933-3059(+)